MEHATRAMILRPGALPLPALPVAPRLVAAGEPAPSAAAQAAPQPASWAVVIAAAVLAAAVVRMRGTGTILFICLATGSLCGTHSWTSAQIGHPALWEPSSGRGTRRGLGLGPLPSASMPTMALRTGTGRKQVPPATGPWAILKRSGPKCDPAEPRRLPRGLRISSIQPYAAHGQKLIRRRSPRPWMRSSRRGRGSN